MSETDTIVLPAFPGSFDTVKQRQFEERELAAKVRKDLTGEATLIAQPSTGVSGTTFEVNDTPYKFEPFLNLDNLVDVHYMMSPETKLYDWQYQELLRASGYIDGSLKGPRMHWTPDAPFMCNYVCCNDAGKDMIMIRDIALGLPLLYRNVIAVITSASHVQLKNQTQAHLERGIKAINARCGTRIYNSIEFYHSCPERGGEINMFATDEPGRAEGWHPREANGRLAMIKNEDKTIPENMQIAFERCHGFSHWFNVSSPGGRSGKFYRICKTATEYPKRPVPFKHWMRKIDWTQCPHISPTYFETKVAEHGINSFFIQTSFLANFYEQETTIAIPISLLEALDGRRFRPDPLDIGIGLDGGGGIDETVVYVRFGPCITRKLFFVERNTVAAVNRIHEFLVDLKDNPANAQRIILNLDDGGMSRTFSDGLERKGWPLYRRLNNQKSTRPDRFMNLGTQMYWHGRTLLERGQVESPQDEKTRLQLTTREYDETKNLGRRMLMPKDEARALLGESPDRADGWILCHWSYKPEKFHEPLSHDAPDPRARKLLSLDEFWRRAETEPHFLRNFHDSAQKTGSDKYERTTLLRGPIQ